MLVHTYTDAHTNLHIHYNNCTQARTYKHTHTHTHTHIHTHSLPSHPLGFTRGGLIFLLAAEVVKQCMMAVLSK